MKKFALFLMAIAVVFMSSAMVETASADTQAKIPEYIRVGLKYGNSAVGAAQVFTKGAITYGFYNGTTFVPVYTGSQGQKATVKKDDDYHILLASFGDDLNKGITYINELKGKNVNGFLMYDGNYSVVTGEYSSKAEADSAASNLQKVLGNQNLTVVVPQKAIYVMADQKLTIKTDKLVARPSNGFIELDNDVTYRGELWFYRQEGSDMTVINNLPLEQYLYSVVPSEMPSSWPQEALKAQAVAARSYAVANCLSSKYAKYGFDVTDDVSSQEYKGYAYGGGKYAGENPNATKAVDATKGIVLTYGGKVISALFSSHSGGYTESSENVFKYPQPYLKAVPDPYSMGYTESLDNWKVTYSQAQLKDILRDQSVDIGDILSIEVINKSPSGRALSVEVTGTKGKYTLQGEQEIRNVFNLKSAMIKSIDVLGEPGGLGTIWVSNGSNVVSKKTQSLYVLKGDSTVGMASERPFVISASGLSQLNASNGVQSVPDSFTFVGSGYGHGVGMSQYGARGLAEKAGKNFVDILKYYYTGITVYDTLNDKSL